MKYLLITLLFPLYMNSQMSVKDSVNITDELNYMKTCLGNHHKEFSFGTVIFCFGAGLGFTTTAMNVPKNEKNALYIGSSIIAMGGAILMMHSNLYFKRASLGLNGNGISVKYRFK